MFTLFKLRREAELESQCCKHTVNTISLKAKTQPVQTLLDYIQTAGKTLKLYFLFIIYDNLFHSGVNGTKHMQSEASFIKQDFKVCAKIC